MKDKMLFLLFLTFPLTLFAKLSPLQQKVLDKVNTFAKEYDITSVGIALIGRENHQKFEQIIEIGNLSLKSSIPVNKYSEFRLGPITELFTASILAYFIQEGQISLNDPASKFLPKSTKIPTYKKQAITLGDLATHTSGLPDLPYEDFSFDVNQMFEFLKNFELKRAPGTEYEHSSLGYAFLSNLLMRMTKRSFPDLINQVLLSPLHLKETSFFLNTEQKKRTVTGYEKQKEISPFEKEKIYSVFIGARGLYSTTEDMLRWLSFNMGKELTSLNSILPLMQNAYHAFHKFSIGLGWKIKPFSSNSKLFFIDGLAFGFGNYVGIVPDEDIGVVILTNQSHLSIQRLGIEILELLHHEKS